MDVEAGGCERYGEAAGADREFEYRAGRSGGVQRAQERNGGLDVGHVGVPVVVHLGHALAVRGRSVPLHKAGL